MRDPTHKTDIPIILLTPSLAEHNAMPTPKAKKPTNEHITIGMNNS